MARSIFFSFHYEDVSSFRANVVRNSWLTMGSDANFIDKSAWEDAQRKGDATLRKLIDEWLKGTSVTVVLVGTETYSRRWVKYEIIRSFVEGKGILPIYINRIYSRNEGIKAKGKNPLDRLAVDVSADCRHLNFYELIDRKWQIFKDLPNDNNRKSNSFYFENRPFSRLKGGQLYKLGDLFGSGYDWVSDNGYKNFAKWIESAAELVGR